MINPGLQIIEKDINEKICSSLDKIGILYRIFTRSKDRKSIDEKIIRKINSGEPYDIDGKKMQDVLGVRVVTYFQDDIYVVKQLLSKIFNYVDEEIDTPDPTVFKPKRTNIICKFSEENRLLFEEIVTASSYENFSLCDSTFELQLRTILSEGWHEIDHSLRYKCKNDWDSHAEKERLLNGIYANLEVNDLAMKALFVELSYNHFKEKNWEAMLRNKFRLKFQLTPLKDELIEFFNKNNDVAKQILKIDRENIITEIASCELSLPVNFNNLIFLINHLEVKNDLLYNLTPDFIKNYK